MGPIVPLGRAILRLALLESEPLLSVQRAVRALCFHGASVLPANEKSRSGTLAPSGTSFVSVGTCFFLQERGRDWRGGDYSCSVGGERLTRLLLVTDASARRRTHAAFLALQHANKNTQAPQTKWKRCIGRSSFKRGFPHTHMHTRTHLHAASFISSTLFIRGSVASPRGIYNEEYISS